MPNPRLRVPDWLSTIMRKFVVEAPAEIDGQVRADRDASRMQLLIRVDCRLQCASAVLPRLPVEVTLTRILSPPLMENASVALSLAEPALKAAPGAMVPKLVVTPVGAAVPYPRMLAASLTPVTEIAWPALPEKTILLPLSSDAVIPAAWRAA